MSSAQVLLASVFPRGEPYGEPGLVALDRATLRVLSYREFTSRDFLPDPRDGGPTPVRHARGLAVRSDRLFVSLFNSIGEYRILDPGALRLRLQRRLTSPAAADLHGICLAPRGIAAASTGGACLLAWDLASEACCRIALDGVAPPAGGDLRFPEPRGGGCTDASWRRPLPPERHLNDVCLTGAGDLVACSLARIAVLSPGTPPIVLADDRAARFHDARPLGDGRILATDGARGELLVLAPGAGSPARIPVADPRAWFVRGVEVVDGRAYVLCSQVVDNRQLSISGRGTAVRRRGAVFGVSIVDLAGGRAVSNSVVSLPGAPAGSVVYQLAAG